MPQAIHPDQCLWHCRKSQLPAGDSSTTGRRDRIPPPDAAGAGPVGCYAQPKPCNLTADWPNVASLGTRISRRQAYGSTSKHEWTPASVILSAAKHPSRSRGRVVQRDSPACGGRRRLALYSPDPSGGGGRSREGNGRSNQNPDAGQSPGLEGTPDRKEPGGKSCCRMVGPRERGHQPSAFSKPTTLPGALLCFLWSICLGALRLFALRPSGTRCGSPSADLRLFASLNDAIFALPRSVRAFARVSIGRSQPLF